MGPNLQLYIKEMGDIYFDMKLGNALYYEMISEQDEGVYFFPIRFAEDLNGDWIITVF